MSDAAWHPDPLGRFELRWWDGEQWTEHVATGGQQGVDPEPIVVGGVEDQEGERTADVADDESAGAVGVAAEESVGGTVDTSGFDPPREEDAIALDDDDAESWPVAEDASGATAAGSGVEGGSGDASDEQVSGDDPSAAADRAVSAGDADSGAAEAVDGDVVASGSTVGDHDDAAAAGQAPPGAAVLAVPQAATPAGPGPGGDLGADGIGGGLLDDPMYAEREGERVVLQNPRLLKVSLGRDVMIKRGSMVAYQGRMTFEAESEGGGLGSLVRRAASSDNSKMARASGSGDLFLADAAYEVHLLELDGGGLVVNGPNLLAFEDGMTFRTRSLGNAGIVAGGVFVTDVSGTGWVAVTAHGTPVRLTTDAPTYVDAGAAVAWSSSLQVDLNVQKLGFKSMRSGEIAQLVFRGEGFVLVQASEGQAVPPHNH